MSKLRELLAAKAGANQPTQPAATPAKQSMADMIRAAKEKEKSAAAAALSENISNSYVPPASAPLEEFQNLTVDLTNDVTSWPDNTATQYDGNQQENLRRHLAAVKSALVTDEISDALTRCMQFIHQNPDMRDLLLPEDVGLLVQALSSSAAVVISRKQENKTVAKKRQAVAQDVMNDLADLGF